MLAALAGLAAAGLGLGMAEAVAGILPGATSLIDAVGQVIIDLQPPGAKDFVVELFGTNDKLALEIVVTLGALALGALFGMVAARRFAAGAAGFGVFGVLAFVAGIGQLQAMPAMVAIQAAISAGVAIQTLSWLLSWLGIARAAATASIPDPARRSFLLRTAAIGIGALSAGVFGRSAIESGRSSPTPSTPLPAPAETVPPLSADADLSPTVRGLTPIVVANDVFYRIDTALLVPSR